MLELKLAFDRPNNNECSRFNKVGAKSSRFAAGTSSQFGYQSFEHQIAFFFQVSVAGSVVVQDPPLPEDVRWVLGSLMQQTQSAESTASSERLYLVGELPKAIKITPFGCFQDSSLYLMLLIQR